MLARVSRDIGPAIDLQHVLTTVLDAMRELVKFKGGSIGLVEDGAIYVAAADPQVSPEVQAARLPVGKGLSGRVVATGEPVYSPDLDADPRVMSSMRKLGSNATIVSYLGVPLVCLGEVIGALQVDSSDQDAFDEEDLAAMVGLAVQVAGAIESARRVEQHRELERLKADFIARVSHELRTPLTIMAGFTKTLIERGDVFDDDQRMAILKKVDAASGRLGGLIEELLAVNQFEQTTQEVKIETVPIRALLEAIRATCDEPTHVEILADPDDEITTDPRFLRASVALLIDNAIKYAGGCRIEASPTRVTVIDEGPGIPVEIQRSISQRFIRGTLKQPGLGLGFSRVRAMASLIGADLSFENPETGSAVSLVFA